MQDQSTHSEQGCNPAHHTFRVKLYDADDGVYLTHNRYVDIHDLFSDLRCSAIVYIELADEGV